MLTYMQDEESRKDRTLKGKKSKRCEMNMYGPLIRPAS